MSQEISNKQTLAISQEAVISESQIQQILDGLSAYCHERTDLLPSDSVRDVLNEEASELMKEMFEPLEVRVKRRTYMFTRRVKVDRTRTSAKMLRATGCAKLIDATVAARMPLGKGDEAEVVFFRIDNKITDDELEHEYDLRGLRPADPYSLGAVNEANPDFCVQYPNGTHWKDKDDHWCIATFRSVTDCRVVVIARDGLGWDSYIWFAGLRKK